MTATAEIRREALTRVPPHLRTAKRCSLEGRYLTVRGELATYRIHLGSADILMAPERRPDPGPGDATHPGPRGVRELRGRESVGHTPRLALWAGQEHPAECADWWRDDLERGVSPFSGWWGSGAAEGAACREPTDWPAARG